MDAYNKLGEITTHTGQKLTLTNNSESLPYLLLLDLIELSASTILLNPSDLLNV